MTGVQTCALPISRLSPPRRALPGPLLLLLFVRAMPLSSDLSVALRPVRCSSTLRPGRASSLLKPGFILLVLLGRFARLESRPDSILLVPGRFARLESRPDLIFLAVADLDS